MQTERRSNTPLEGCSTAIGDLFRAQFARLHEWRDVIEGAGTGLSGSELDDLVAGFTVPELGRPNPMLIGAGYIGGEAGVKPGAPHFRWWIGPMPASPLAASTTAPTRLDILARSYADYVRDFTRLEWYHIPELTGRAHITGPYVDYLCICDYVLTLTVPVRSHGAMIGVVGGDMYVSRLEPEVLPGMRAVGRECALVNESGRVIVSTGAHMPAGALLDARSEQGTKYLSVRCPSTPFRLVAWHPAERPKRSRTLTSGSI